MKNNILTWLLNNANSCAPANTNDICIAFGIANHTAWKLLKDLAKSRLVQRISPDGGAIGEQAKWYAI